MNGALVGIVAATLLALGLGFLARRGRQMGLGQWTIAGRSFGAPLVFLLMAGEIYTTFAFLGGREVRPGKTMPPPSAPSVRIRAYAVLGGIEVKTK